MGAVLAVALAAAAGIFGFKTEGWRWRQVAAGAALGALGGIGANVALGGCAFSDDVDAVQHVLGWGISLAFGWGVAGLVRLVLNQTGSSASGKEMAGELRSGTYHLGWWWPWVLLAPTGAVLVVFLYTPAIQTFTLATKLARLGAPRSIDVCLGNFSELLSPSPYVVVGMPLLAVGVMWGLGLWKKRANDRSLSLSIANALQPFGLVVLLAALYLVFRGGTTGYRGIYLNTMIVSAGTVLGGMALGLAVAYLAFQRVRGVGVYRTLLIWPYAISPPIAGILFFMMFDPTAGIFNHLFDLVGIPFPNYREDAALARFTVIAASVWKILGYNVLFYLAGLQTVPVDQMEAAVLDGASAWGRFKSVVMPALGPITFFLLVTNLTYAFFDVYGTIDYLTKGAPAGATSVAIYEIIRVGVDNRDIGRGAAQSVLLFLAVIGLTAWQFRQSQGRISYGGAG